MGPGVGIPGSGYTIMLIQTMGDIRFEVQDQWRVITFSLTVGSMASVGGQDPQPQPQPRPRPGPTNPTDPTDLTGGGESAQYFVYAVNTSGWSLYIGRTEQVEGRPSSSFTDGGTGNTPVEFRKLSNGFPSHEAALAWLKPQVSFGHDSVWTGRWVRFGGTEYRTVHVPEVN